MLNIINHKACLGCGLCASVGKTTNCAINIGDDGFYYPSSITDPKDTLFIDKICPGRNVRIGNNRSKEIWGHVKEIYEGWATDKNIRHSASSGGVLSAICIELLRSRYVSAILHVGNCEDSPKFNSLQISRTEEDVLKRCSSRYAPANVFSEIDKFLDLNERFAFVGKPCDITAIKAYLKECPHYKHKIKIFLSFFCAGIPSYLGTDKLLDSNKKLTCLKYRGNGWPGFFTAKYNDGTEFKMSYSDSWGSVLGSYVNYRCKICPDGIGLDADIVAADSWVTKDGYPDFEERDGRNFVLVRSDIGGEIIDKCVSDGALYLENLDSKSISKKQPYQFNRRRQLGWRILGVQIASGWFYRFSGIGLYRNLVLINPLKGIKICIGTIKRYFAK